MNPIVTIKKAIFVTLSYTGASQYIRMSWKSSFIRIKCLHIFTCINLYPYNLYYIKIYLIYKHNIVFLNM